MELLAIKLIIALLLLLVAFEALRIIFYTQKGVLAGKKAKKVERPHPRPRKRILVIGDCGTVSVGVTNPQYSIVGRLGHDFPDCEIVNASHNSMSLWRLERTLRKLSKENFDVVIMHIGSMDALMLTPKIFLQKILKRIPGHTTTMKAKTVALVSPCNLGSCPLFRFPLDRLYDRRSQVMTNLFEQTSTENKLIHIPLYEPRKSDSLVYPTPLFTGDLVHPNDAGHEIWYKKIKAGLLSSSPDFYV